MKVCIYARVSKEGDPEGNGVSIELQRVKLRALAEAKSWEIATEYVDDGESGRSLIRPAIQRLVADTKAKPRPWDGVLIYRFDRLARNLKDLLTLLEVFETRKVALVSLTESLDASTPMGRFAISILGAAAALEREQISARTSEAIRFKKQNLRVYSGTTALGFVRKGNILEPAPDELETVRIAFRLRAEGKTLRQIGRVLNEQRRFTKRGKPWSAESLRYLLQNRSLYEAFVN